MKIDFPRHVKRITSGRRKNEGASVMSVKCHPWIRIFSNIDENLAKNAMIFVYTRKK